MYNPKKPFFVILKVYSTSSDQIKNSFIGKPTFFTAVVLTNNETKDAVYTKNKLSSSYLLKGTLLIRDFIDGIYIKCGVLSIHNTLLYI